MRETEMTRRSRTQSAGQTLEGSRAPVRRRGAPLRNTSDTNDLPALLVWIESCIDRGPARSRRLETKRHTDCYSRNMATMVSATQSTTERFLEILKSFDTAILLTHAPDGSLHGRPMAFADVEADGTLWFVTRIDSPKIEELSADPRAFVTCQDSNQYATLGGTCEVSKNQRKLDEVWKESYKVWFDGKDDPRLVLLRVTPENGEYWDNSGSKGVRYAFRAVAAYVQGKTMDEKADDPTQHGKVAL